MENTLIQKQATCMEELRYQVQELLHWNDEQFGMFVYETGLSYLDAYYGDDQKIKDHLSGRKEYWNWWKLQFFARDKSFVEHIQTDVPLSNRLTIYSALHNPEVLACEIYPSRIVLGSDFPTLKIQMQ